MRTVVHHKAGREFDDLAERLVPVVEEIVPLVEEVTGLALPDAVVIRTMTVRKWQQAHWRQSKRRLREETLQLRPSINECRAAKAHAVSLRNDRRDAWLSIGAQLVTFRRDHPELAVLPEALREAGLLHDEAFLRKLVSHELTHLAQYTTDDDAWSLSRTLYPDQRGVADRDYTLLLEGHAYWADRQITTRLLGAPVPTAEISPHATPRYRAYADTPGRAEALKYLTTAIDSVSRIVDAKGLDTFNEVWSSPELVPLKSEAATPELWLKRFG
ncbi:hypothetical protein KBP30_00405 [Streptomyces sp. Go40/10]|uniref:hypothetical protein n=1 Tax=Streptomyces sp. Go40/10 TaxID=2825844 RepID=UPI001E35F7A9|nr:hypothetical protein [Streptomyces sp. Go40/10]UFQ99792.1 hypothetical protein KBP30_00405 [Streptomyces sp. Go40/10]